MMPLAPTAGSVVPRRIVQLLLGAAVVCAPAAAAQPRWALRPDGIGPVRAGMSLAAAGRALGESLAARYADFERCDFVVPRTAPHGVSLMVIADTVVRVDVEEGAVTTAEGVGIGAPEAWVLDVYRGRVRVEPHPYAGPEGHYLIVDVPGDTRHRMIFETDGQRVTSFRAGLRDAADLIEGCA